MLPSPPALQNLNSIGMSTGRERGELITPASPGNVTRTVRRSTRLVFAAIVFALFALIPGSLSAQEKKPPICKVELGRIGFISNEMGEGAGRYKVGMWTPVYMKIKAGPQGIHRKGPNEPMPYIQVENEDNEEVGTIYRTPFEMEPNEERWVMSYAKPGRMSDVKMRVFIGDLPPFPPPIGPYGSLDLNTHLYVSLGERIPDLQKALVNMSPFKNQNMGGQPNNIPETKPRYAGFEVDPNLLPDNWFGYQGVDLLFLSTRDKDFLLHLAKDSDASRARLRAIAQYVRRGGRLVIGVSARNADVLAPVLQSPVWQPPVPVVPPREGTIPEAARLNALQNFGGAQIQVPFPPGKLTLLEPAKLLPGSWEVLAAATDATNREVGKPLIARMPYGRGSITLLAFSLDEPPFTNWGGQGQQGQGDRAKFLQKLLEQLAPRVGNVQEQDPRNNPDLSTDLQRTLDNFDVRVIPFGYVALFIVLYIIVVGPLDFLVLKYVFKRLEWTWFTFPTVVLAVSVAAYFTAYAIKGNELKINKVDLIDIDQRTNVDAKGQTKKAAAYGNTFFTILSPRIQNYTVGIEPNPVFWGQNAEKPASADMVTWLGRAEWDDFRGMGRGGGQGFFRKPYHYEADATGLVDVPIPVWTTKAFEASWEINSLAPPLDAKLTYYVGIEKGKELRVAGTIKSGLGVDLEDAYLFYLDQAYPIEGGVPKAKEILLSLELGQGKKISEWAPAGKDGNRLQTAQGAPYNPSPLMRQIQFNEAVNVANTSRNHALRPLDLSWRIRSENDLAKERGVREAILVGRVKFAVGAAESLTGDVNNPLPTNLWLGDLPAPNKTRPALVGVLAQDTFVRVLLPLKPKE